MYGTSSNSSASAVDLALSVRPNRALRLTESSTGDFIEARSESWLAGAIKASVGNVGQHHLVSKWQDWAGADTTVGEDIVTSDSGSSLALTVTDGSLAIASNVGLTFAVDLKIFCVAGFRLAHSVLRNDDAAVGVSWRSFYENCRGSGWWEL